jgi:hypothetical protein
VLQANFDGPPERPAHEHPVDAAGVSLKEPLAALRAWSASPPEPGWWHWVVGVDPTGRVTLPANAWAVLDAWGSVGAVMRGRALVLRDGEGAEVHADRRGRVTLPAWLRSACGPGDAAVIVAVRRPPAGDVAVIAPVNVLDALVGDLAGEVA